MSKYRPGYIEGKAKVGFYIDPEVQQALKIRAAQTGESMSGIAERALRRELGMVELARKTVAVNILDVEDALRIDQFEADLTGTRQELLEQAIALVESKGYRVVREHSEVTEYSDGTVAVAVTVEAE